MFLYHDFIWFNETVQYWKIFPQYENSTGGNMLASGKHNKINCFFVSLNRCVLEYLLLGIYHLSVEIRSIGVLIPHTELNIARIVVTSQA